MTPTKTTAASGGAWKGFNGWRKPGLPPGMLPPHSAVQGSRLSGPSQGRHATGPTLPPPALSTGLHLHPPRPHRSGGSTVGLCCSLISPQAYTSTIHDLTGLVAPRWSSATRTTTPVPTLSHSQTDYATLLPSAPELRGVAGGSRSSVIALRSDGTSADLGLKREFFEFRTSNFEIFPPLPPPPPRAIGALSGPQRRRSRTR